MRKIKYMAWDDSISKMIPWEELIKHCPDGRLFYDVIGMFTGENYHYHLIQYIGIKDKEGNELYEKDVVKFKTCHDSIYYIGVIEWGDDGCYYLVTTDGKVPILYMLPDVVDFKSFKKIGNIYKNPDLVPYYKE